MKPKVLIACVTYKKDEVYLNYFMERIRSQDYKDFDLLFVDTSENKESVNTLNKKGDFVISVNSEGLNRIEKILKGRMAARDFFLSKEYDFLMFVDTDVLLPEKALSKLVDDDKDVVAGVCMSEMVVSGKKQIRPVVYGFGEKGHAIPFGLKQVMGDSLIEISCAGFGCVMIKRKVVKKIELRYFKESGAGEDIAFFVDARSQGFKTFVDTSVKCWHLVYPPNDKRNEIFNLKNYKIT